MHRVPVPATMREVLLVTALMSGPALAEEHAGPAPCESLRQAGDAAGAETLAREVLSRSPTSAEDSLAQSNTVECLVRALCELHPQITDETVALARQSVQIREHILGPNDPEVADALTLLAFTLRVRNEVDDARALLERSRAIRDAGDDELEVARVDFALGGLEITAGDYAAATPYYERALEIRRRHLEPDDPELANALTGLGGCYLRTGRYVETQPIFGEAIDILKATLGSDHPRTVETMEYLAISYLYVGDFASAAPLLEGTLDAYVARYGPDHPAAARVRGNLGMAYFNLGDFRRCLPLFEASVATYERTLGPDHVRSTASLYQLAQARWNLGRYDEALELFGKVVEIRREVLGSEHPDYAKGLMGLGAAEMTLGDLQAARRRYEEALAIYEQTVGQDHPQFAISLYSYADLLVRMGSLAEAREVLDQAVPLHEKALGPDHTRLGWALHLYGIVLRRQGEWEAAALHAQRSAAIWEAIDPEHSNVAFAYLQLANVRAHRGEIDRAREYLDRGIEILVAAQGEDASNLTALYRTSAMLEAQAGNLDVAIDRALEAERISRGQLRLMARTLPEGMLLDYLEARNLGLDIALSVVLTEPTSDRIQRVWNAQIDSRAVVFDEMAARRRRLIDAHDPETATLEGELGDILAELAYLTLTAREGEASANHGTRVDFLEVRRREVERALATRSQAFRERQAQHEPVTVSALVAALPPGAGLVAVVRHSLHPVEPGAAWGDIDVTDNLVYTGLVLPAGGGEPRIMALGSADQLEEAVLDVRRAMGQAPVQAGSDEYIASSAQLRDMVWLPVQAVLGSANGVFVVPDGALHLINLAAIPGDESPYLIEEMTFIHDLSAERDLLATADLDGGSGGLLALGAPAYDADCTKLSATLAGVPPPDPSAGPSRHVRGGRVHCQDFAWVTFSPLPASGREARDVAELWMTAGGDGSKEVPVVLVDTAANEEAFRSLGPGRAVLHLATHGFFLQGRCGLTQGSADLSTASVTRGIGGMRPAGTGGPVRESPLLLSGLVLAGANTRTQAGLEADDGILTAEEIALLDLSGTQWAVLSACDSGLGDVQNGEGVLGLRRAFRVAGARSVIMSLWGVEDAAAHEWMEALYRARFVNGAGTAEAVRAAAVSVLDRRREAGESTHPFYWASFVASGDWR